MQILIAALLVTNGALANVRIVALGTSLTQNGNWPDRLAETLSTCMTEPVFVEKIALAGEGSAWGKQQVGRIARSPPAAVLIEFAVNDADMLDGVALATSRRNHRFIIEHLKRAAPGTAIILMTTNPTFGPRGWIRPFLVDYYDLYRNLAAQGGAYLIDLHPVWTQAIDRNDRDKLIPDGLHPTDESFSAIALPALRDRLIEIFAARMKEIMRGCRPTGVRTFETPTDVLPD